ncbi:AfsR/SARP family transcriptional regulator [Streptomyces hainanensis]|uniref:AfsR family transcriptional regulator n=1 Tax=Streptomyces hainanensis TaxID=402648 RepID=A0A4R4TFL8_9ACTN|nr:AfsR/SARP family transcriptional regulator [Streptomyces hainanensis]TDC73723.1 AfsR family transcriptional regulator [Streptomyces hainanensis]
MRFQLLGPLSLTDGVETVVLQPSKPSNLLAALLLRSNTLVSAEYLQRMIWGDEQPATARASLQTCVLRLRRLFAKHGVLDTPIEAVPGGYRITADARSLDLVDFRERVRAAERSDAGPDAELGMLRDALTLWQGSLLANVRSEPMHRDEVPRLHEERLRVVERVCDLHLELGHCGQAVVELWSLTRAHPGHGRFREQLIEGLYRTGRQSEALAEYRRFKAFLRQALGVDPSAALQRLELAILRGEELRSVAPARVELSARPEPPEVPWFTGRAAEVTALTERLRKTAGRPALELVCGAPGIGKTSLAQQVAHLTGAEFPGGRLLLRLTDQEGRPRPAAEVDDELAAALPGFQRGGGPRALLVLDDVTDPAQVRRLLPGTGEHAVIVTSRMGLAGLVATHGGRVRRLDTFRPDESRELLAAVLGEERVTAEPEATDALAAACGHHPLALVIAAARLLTRPALGLADGLCWIAADPLARLSLPDAPLMSVPRVVRGALERLEPALAEALLALGGLPSARFGRAEAAGVLGLPEAEADGVLERLVDAGLLEDGPPGPYRLHGLLRLYAGPTGHRAPPGKPPDRPADRPVGRAPDRGPDRGPGREPDREPDRGAGQGPDHRPNERPRQRV